MTPELEAAYADLAAVAREASMARPDARTTPHGSPPRWYLLRHNYMQALRSALERLDKAEGKGGTP